MQRFEWWLLNIQLQIYAYLGQNIKAIGFTKLGIKTQDHSYLVCVSLQKWYTEIDLQSEDKTRHNHIYSPACAVGMTLTLITECPAADESFLEQYLSYYISSSRIGNENVNFIINFASF